MIVRGDVAGTSARLQPAEIRVHWDRASLADLLRLFRGRDYGVRGLFALDATAKSGASGAKDSPLGQPGDWSYELQARATQIHRWDLTERTDNPNVNVHLLGRLNVATGNALAERIVVETSKSNLRGTARATIASANPSWEVHLDSAGVQAADVLSWCRAFQPDVDDAIAVNQYFTGQMSLRGWPLQLEEAVFSSAGGEARIAGLGSPVRIGAVEGGRQRAKFTIEPVRLWYGPTSGHSEPAAAATTTSAKRRTANDGRGVVNLGLTHDFDEHAGRLTIDGHVEKVADVLKVAAAFGRPLNHGWEFAGAAGAALRWEWSDSGAARPLEWPDRRCKGRPSGRWPEPASATGQDQPGMEGWPAHGGHRQTLRGSVAHGLVQSPKLIPRTTTVPPNGIFNYTPINWTRRNSTAGSARARDQAGCSAFLPSLLGGAASTPTTTPNVHASELVRRVDAEGELQIDEFTLEKLKFQQVRAVGALARSSSRCSRGAGAMGGRDRSRQGGCAISSAAGLRRHRRSGPRGSGATARSRPCCGTF